MLLVCSGASLAQTPDGQTPAMETVCDVESGAAFGLCNAYCEAMDCETANPAASATACGKVRDQFKRIAGHDMPCENACPCQAIPEFNAALAGHTLECGGNSGNGISLLTDTGFVESKEDPSSPTGGSCSVLSTTPQIVLNITLEEVAACTQLLLEHCTPE